MLNGIGRLLFLKLFVRRRCVRSDPQSFLPVETTQINDVSRAYPHDSPTGRTT